MSEVQYDKKGQPQLPVGDRMRLAEKKWCETCGQPFWAVVNKQHPKRFCSPKCQGKWRTKYWKQKRTARRCIICGRIRYWKPSEASRHKTCNSQHCVRQLQISTARERQGQNGFGKYQGKKAKKDKPA